MANPYHDEKGKFSSGDTAASNGQRALRKLYGVSTEADKRVSAARAEVRLQKHLAQVKATREKAERLAAREARVKDAGGVQAFKRLQADRVNAVMARQLR